jgi:hypothetical protein
MRTLHSIQPVRPERDFAVRYYGVNYRQLFHGLTHIVRVPRNLPHQPIGHRDRRYFQPWQLGFRVLPEAQFDPLTAALCGPLRTRSMTPVIEAAWRSPFGRCRECFAINPEPLWSNDNTFDPFYDQTPDDRIFLPDPVSGL